MDTDICGECVITENPKLKNICIHNGCNKNSSFNNIGEKQRLYCNTHKKPEMVNVAAKSCYNEFCKKQPKFNYKNKKGGISCLEHANPEMVNVLLKTCEFEGCLFSPAFNYEDKKNGIYCYGHKKINMVNVVSKTCCFIDCNKIPNFNYPDKKKRIYCYGHKKINMVNIVSKTCCFIGCKTIPNFNYPDNINNGIFCSGHKKINMVNVVSKTCDFVDCNKTPNFNYPNKKGGGFCADHKQPDMIDVKHKSCLHDWCDTRATSNKKYDGYCLRCFIYTFPDKPVTRNYKTKEFAVAEFVKTSFPNYTWIADKTVQDGCSRRRPDLLLDLGESIIIIEVDENQHTDYDCSCENRRIMEISKDAGHRPIVFIRFNPDDYKNGDKNITSCWGANGNGICTVKKSKTKEWSGRLNSLKEQIEYWIEHRSDKMVETVQLYYDR